MVLVDAIASSTAVNSFDVVQGSIVKAIWLEFWIINIGATGEDSQFNMSIYKLPGGSTDMTYAQSINLGAYENKKNVLYSTQANLIAEVDGGMAFPTYKGWFKIPKGKQRMGLGDQIIAAISSTGQAARICGLATYKEYR